MSPPSRDTLIESEFFGTAPGAYTGADRKGRDGKFEIADGGTLFLDEIGEMPLQLQVKLLRVLQEREIEPVGSDKVAKVNVRVIAATNVDLRKRVNERGVPGRSLLPAQCAFDRNAATARLPRRPASDFGAGLLDDIILNPTITPAHGSRPRVLPRLRGAPAPGNARELRNILERALILSNSGPADRR